METAKQMKKEDKSICSGSTLINSCESKSESKNDSESRRTDQIIESERNSESCIDEMDDKKYEFTLE